MIEDTSRNDCELDDQLCKMERATEKMKMKHEKEGCERPDSRDGLKNVVKVSHLESEMKLPKRRVALLEQETDRMLSKNQLEAGRQVMPSKAASYSALRLRPKRHFGGSMILLLLLLLLSWAALAQAGPYGRKSAQPRGLLGQQAVRKTHYEPSMQLPQL